MRPTSLGWRERVGSFLELIEGSSPERWTEEDLKKRRAERFDTPLVVVRKRGGIAAKVTEELTRANLLASDPLVKPSRCAALAINANATTKGADGEYNPDLMPFSQCATCEVPLSTFLERVDRPFGLGTPASDDSNIQLQTHGIQGPQLPALGRLLSGNAPRLFRHPVLDKKFFPPSCRNPPALGFAGTLRGLPFHQHQANWNEAVVGRKMFAFFPPRVRAADNQDNKMPCGWPPWAPKAAEQSDGEQINKMLGSFFTGRYNASARPPAAAEGGGGGESPPLTTCLDQSITPLNWLVHEMPLLAAEHRPLLFIAHPGELVWIPDDWLHLTINVDDALCVPRRASPGCLTAAGVRAGASGGGGGGGGDSLVSAGAQCSGVWHPARPRARLPKKKSWEWWGGCEERGRGGGREGGGGG